DSMLPSTLRLRSTSAPLPYTTLFRSPALRRIVPPSASVVVPSTAIPGPPRVMSPSENTLRVPPPVCGVPASLAPVRSIRFEPGKIGRHTSELQSPDHLVCRLLLEKKN